MKQKVFILITVLFSSCSELTSINNKLVSRVGDHYLYESDIPDFSSYEDSLIKKKGFY